MTVQTFLQAGRESSLNLLVRVPLKAMRDIEFPGARAGYLDLDRVDPTAAGRRDSCGSPISSKCTKADARLPKPRVVETRLSLESDRPLPSYETALAHVDGSEARRRHALFLEPDDARRAVRVPDSVGPVALLDSSRRSTGWPRAWSSRCDSCRRAARCARLNSTAIPAWCASIPRWYQAALRFVKLGFFHILDGTDHLLFLFCLVIPFRRFRALIPIVTAFTVAHSITLIASAYNLAPDALWFPPLIETLIAMSIVYMALENIVGGSNVQRRWMITFGFGLVHGFGFSFALRQTMQFAGSHLLTSLLSFNVGVELGQLLVLALMIPAAGASLPLRGGRADGDHHSVGAGGAHGLALDDRPLPGAQPVSNSLAGAGGGSARESPALADAHRDRGRLGLAGLRFPLAAHRSDKPRKRSRRAHPMSHWTVQGGGCTSPLTPI